MAKSYVVRRNQILAEHIGVRGMETSFKYQSVSKYPATRHCKSLWVIKHWLWSYIREAYWNSVNFLGEWGELFSSKFSQLPGLHIPGVPYNLESQVTWHMITVFCQVNNFVIKFFYIKRGWVSPSFQSDQRQATCLYCYLYTESIQNMTVLSKG